MENSTRAVSRETAEHYVWGDACDGWRLLDRPDLSVIEERVPAGGAEVAHVHGHARQFFYVLEGMARLEFENRSVELAPGQGLEVPPGLAHRFVNVGDGDVRFLVVSAPTTRGDRANLSK